MTFTKPPYFHQKLSLKSVSSLGLMVGLLSQPAFAHDDLLHRVDEVVVYGRALDKIGEAKTASEGTVGYSDFENRPLSRSGELVEVIPGAVATQHSGEGKSNQYFLRGFNLDHGTDFSASVDGVPVNLRTHGHGQGYLDLNFVIPELVERVDYRKGPYSAQVGDFSTAGSAQYLTRESLDHNFLQLTAGEYGYLRGVAAGTQQLSERTSLLLGGEIQRYDGPWDLDQDLKKFNGLAKLIHVGGLSRSVLSASYYQSDWTATDQIPLRAVQEGTIDRYGFIDDDLGGETHRASLGFDSQIFSSSGAETNINLYIVDYDLSLFSNFTYFLNDPVNGDEFEQRDSRQYFGGSVNHSRQLWDNLTLSTGAEFRRDNIGELGLFNTAGRERLSTVRQDKVKETSAAIWGEVEYALTNSLRVNGGIRGNYFKADVEALSLAQNGGESDDTLLSPSLGLAWQAAPNLELYANYGQGFHSNDVRGTTISVDPVTLDPVDTVPLLVKSKGQEIGFRLEKGDFRLNAAAFYLELDSELVFVGDAGTTEANDATERLGVEGNIFWLPNDWLVLDVGGAYTDARFSDVAIADRIPGAVETVLSGGALMKFDKLTLNTRLRHFGAAPLIEDNSTRSEPTTLVNFSAHYDLHDVTFGLELLNVLDAKDSDISYLFESQLAGEAQPVEDIHFHSVEPRQIRASIRYNF
ncbi:outer membrane receptor protein involved in Fe transport [Litorimonas taeanensis]|uniref:Outer membrane receptor protein involved in Fe transport n=1 Tax=Litorimonas taeanensis TaxID=568099 RepID=A0A420WLC6_9PROT|nr:TonB-dependent receptor [Litorimonas taeanensis]RKQ71824.1 outer membrane receptor protein involved in Fe transport [Litorimonas taeanensis]